MMSLLAAIGQVLVPPARLSDVDRLVIGAMVENGFTPAEIGARFGYAPEEIEGAADLRRETARRAL